MKDPRPVMTTTQVTKGKPYVCNICKAYILTQPVQPKDSLSPSYPRHKHGHIEIHTVHTKHILCIVF